MPTCVSCIVDSTIEDWQITPKIMQMEYCKVKEATCLVLKFKVLAGLVFSSFIFFMDFSFHGIIYI